MPSTPIANATNRAAIPADWVRISPGASAEMTVMQAHFTQHAFERHSHATYSVGVTRSGVQTFHHRGSHHASLAGDAILFNPDEAHDGQRGTEAGFGYSIIYLEPALVHGWMREAGGPRYFRQPVVHDPAAAAALGRALDAHGIATEALRAEELTAAAVVQLLQRHGEAPHSGQGRDASPARLQQVRDYLHAHYADNIGVQTLADVAGLSRIHLTRAFSAHFGVPPHIYLTMLRVQAAQRALLAGDSLADAAAAHGFTDQSHFSRRFKGSTGLPPGAWLKQMARDL